tara:strand:- start:549 stop:950 length:402 start_codon:yes stop_codon:yes gene_type:complete
MYYGVAPFSWEDAVKQLHADASTRSESEISARSRYMHEVPPLSWEDADKQFYAEKAARSESEKAARSRYMLDVAPLSWEDADKQFYAAEAAKVAARNDRCNAAALPVHKTRAARSEQGEDLAAAQVITSMRKA